MKDAQISITDEIPVDEFAGMSIETANRWVIHRVREAARAEVERQGGRFDANRLERLETTKRAHAITGVDHVVVFATWRAEVPDHVELDTGRPA